MNLPNRLTLSRIALTVVFMFLLFSKGPVMKTGALLVFCLASLTDYWDGQLARDRNQITAFGRLMDPIADKLLTLSAFIAFVEMKIIPAWMVILIISRDLLITGLRFLMPSRDEKGVAARSSGKHKTALQFSAIVGVLIFLIIEETSFWKPEWTPISQHFIYFSMLFIVAVTLGSGVHYLMENKEFFDEHAY